MNCTYAPSLQSGTISQRHSTPSAGGYSLQHLLVLLQLDVVSLVDAGESPLLGDDDLLASGELVTGTAESLHDDGGVGVLGADGEDDLANVDTGHGAVGLAPGATHAGLETARKKNVSA